MKPKRIQRKRIKGWRMPPNTVYVGRPSKWGNPYKVLIYAFHGNYIYSPLISINLYKGYIQHQIKAIKKELRGKNLACWCPLVDKNGNKVPCHTDILLKIANS